MLLVPISPTFRRWESAEKVSNDILETWNAGYTLESGLVAANVVLQRWLGHRLDPPTSRLDALLTDQVGVSPTTPALFIGGVWYPNPVAFARRGDEFTAVPALRAARGQMHGDFHGYNVLLTQRRHDVADYYLIDLAFYEEETYLFFDHGYIELAYLLRARENVDSGRWLELLDGVFRLIFRIIYQVVVELIIIGIWKLIMKAFSAVFRRNSKTAPEKEAEDRQPQSK